MIRKYWKLGAVAAGCLAIGAGASAIASAGASTSAGTGTAQHPATARGRAGGLGSRSLARRAVEGDVVVATKAGKFVSVTFARGEVQSVSGQQLTLAEGTKKRTYRTVTLTIPTTARVREDRSVASLSSLTPGQRVVVLQAPQRTLVIARG